MTRIFYNVKETAKALNISRSKLYEVMNAGALETVKIGQRRLIRIDSVTAYADSLKEAA